MGGYRDLGVRTYAAIIGAGLGLAAGIVDTLVPGSPLDALKDAHAPLRDIVSAWAIVGAGVLELVTFLVWVHGVARNVQALGRTGLRFTPFTSVGWFFIPIANFYMPYRALAEAWRASDPDDKTADGWQQAPAPLKLLGWWLLTMLSVIQDDGPTDLGFLGAAIAVASSGLFVLLALELRERQAACAAARPPAP